MKKHRQIELTETPDKLSYSALVAAICEKIKNSDFIACDNLENIKTALKSAEKKEA